jgi:hypothetical protein
LKKNYLADDKEEDGTLYEIQDVVGWTMGSDAMV